MLKINFLVVCYILKRILCTITPFAYDIILRSAPLLQYTRYAYSTGRPAGETQLEYGSSRELKKNLNDINCVDMNIPLLTKQGVGLANFGLKLGT